MLINKKIGSRSEEILGESFLYMINRIKLAKEK